MTGECKTGQRRTSPCAAVTTIDSGESAISPKHYNSDFKKRAKIPGQQDKSKTNLQRGEDKGMAILYCVLSH